MHCTQFTQKAEADFMMGGQLKDRNMMNTGRDRNSKRYEPEGAKALEGDRLHSPLLRC